MSKIDTYKADLGYGSRGNLFKVVLTIPSVVSSKFDYVADLELLCHDVNFPQPRTIDTATINMYNETFQYATKRSEPEDLTIKFRLPEDMLVRDMIEYWMNQIQKPRFGDYDGTRISPSEYKTDNFSVQILGKDLSTVYRTAQGYGVYPTDINGFDLDVTKSDMHEVTVKFSVDYFNITNGADDGTIVPK